MRLEIISGQEKIVWKLRHEFNEMKKNLSNNTLSLCYPERTWVHPKQQYLNTRAYARECIENNKDFIVLTLSEHVLNAVRVEIKRAKFDGAKIHHFLDDGTEICGEIDRDGMLSEWVDEIFNMGTRELTDLLS